MDTRKIMFMPLDLPKCSFKEELIKNFKSPGQNPVNAKAFESQKFTKTTKSVYDVTEWIDVTSNIAKYCEEILPIERLVNIKIHHYIHPGDLHIDFMFPENNLSLYNHFLTSEPCGYRMVIAPGKLDNPTVQTLDGKKHHAKMPTDTDWYVMNFTKCLHAGLLYDPARYVLYTQFWLNKEKHDMIIERSIEKYADYIIWDQLVTY